VVALAFASSERATRVVNTMFTFPSFHATTELASHHKRFSSHDCFYCYLPNYRIKFRCSQSRCKHQLVSDCGLLLRGCGRSWLLCLRHALVALAGADDDTRNADSIADEDHNSNFRQVGIDFVLKLLPPRGLGAFAHRWPSIRLRTGFFLGKHELEFAGAHIL
jgi:hypothetical protein